MRKPLPSLRRVDRIGAGAGVVAAVVALGVLFVPSSIGVADNADYARMTCQLGLVPDVPSGFNTREAYVWFAAKPGPKPRYEMCEYRSPALEPLRVGTWISPHLPGGDALDLRLVGAVYAVTFGVAVGLLVAAIPGSNRVRLLAAAVAIVVLADVGMVAWFTSAYSEPMGYVGLVAVTALLMGLWRRPTPARLVAVTAVGFVLITTKPQYGTLAVVLIPAVLARPVPAGRLRGPWLNRAPRLLAAAALLVAGSIAVRGTPDFIAQANKFNAFFYGLLGHSPDVQADLQEFDLPAELSRYAGRPIWTTSHALSDPTVVAFEERVSYTDIAGFYIAHPDRAAGLAARGFEAGADPRVQYLGHYGYEPDRPPRQQACRLCVMSSIGRWARPAAPLLVPLLWVGAVTLGLRRVRRAHDPADRAAGGALLLVTSVAVVAFGTAALGEADYEFTKHLFLSSAANYLLVVLVASVLLDRLSARRRADAAAPAAPSPSEPPHQLAGYPG